MYFCQVIWWYLYFFGISETSCPVLCYSLWLRILEYSFFSQPVFPFITVWRRKKTPNCTASVCCYYWCYTCPSPEVRAHTLWLVWTGHVGKQSQFSKGCFTSRSTSNAELWRREVTHFMDVSDTASESRMFQNGLRAILKYVINLKSAVFL